MMLLVIDITKGIQVCWHSRTAAAAVFSSVMRLPDASDAKCPWICTASCADGLTCAGSDSRVPGGRRDRCRSHGGGAEQMRSGEPACRTTHQLWHAQADLTCCKSDARNSCCGPMLGSQHSQLPPGPWSHPEEAASPKMQADQHSAVGISQSTSCCQPPPWHVQVPAEQREKRVQSARQVIRRTLASTRFAGCAVIPASARPGLPQVHARASLRQGCRSSCQPAFWSVVFVWRNARHGLLSACLL